MFSFIYYNNQWVAFFLQFLFLSTFFIVIQVQFSPFPPPLHPTSAIPHFPHLIPPLFSSVHVSFLHAPKNSSTPPPHYALPTPFWVLSVLNFKVWLYFDSFFVFLIRFHIWVRSDGICLALIGFFHLA